MTKLPQRVKPGDIWCLGGHRLACVDTTSATGVDRLFGGERWDVMVTSPPYAQQRSYGLARFDWDRLMMGMTSAALEHAADRFHALVNLGLVHRAGCVYEYWQRWLAFCKDMGLPLFAWHVWDKGAGMPGFHHGRLALAHEFVFHLARNPWPATKWVPKKHIGMRTNARANRCKDGSMRPWCNPQAGLQPTKVPDSVIRINREYQRGIHTSHHPAVFPIELPRFLLRTFGKPGGIVYEPFAGSGTTILAAQELGMLVRATELSPAYCDLILARFEQSCGVAAKKA